RAFWISPSLLIERDDIYVHVNQTGKMVNNRNFSQVPVYTQRPLALAANAPGATPFKVIPIHYDTSTDRASILKNVGGIGIMTEDWFTNSTRPSLTGNFTGTYAPHRPGVVNGGPLTSWSPARGWN
ncbi:MAG: hypothetical protein LBC80_08880, partial [Treponema sp.]|nr:hypothetical protein [Treponema sp.]